jgi:5'-3' exonuclease
MERTFLILDVNFLCYRNFYAMGRLSYDGIKTGVIYGFLRDLAGMQDRFMCDRLVFCFDHGAPLRQRIYRGYKLNRHGPQSIDMMSNEEKTARQQLTHQVDLLMMDYLPRIGYKNVLYEKGYEADDIIASVSENLSDDDTGIIVSADRDLFQLIRFNVSVWKPGNFKVPPVMTTLQSFKRKFGISPRHWAHVKAIAGCSTDEIPGVGGVGEITAIKYLNGGLKEDSKAYQTIRSDRGRSIVHRNRPLVELPLKGTPVFNLVDDKVTQTGWQDVCELLGIRSLRNSTPYSSRERRRH